MLFDFIYYWKNYGFKWALFYVQYGLDVIDNEITLIDNTSVDCLWDECDCLDFI
jgi:hypothetical protein